MAYGCKEVLFFGTIPSFLGTTGGPGIIGLRSKMSFFGDNRFIAGITLH